MIAGLPHYNLLPKQGLSTHQCFPVTWHLRSLQRQAPRVEAPSPQTLETKERRPTPLFCHCAIHLQVKAHKGSVTCQDGSCRSGRAH